MFFAGVLLRFNSSFRLVRTWPLSLSVVAMAVFAYFSPLFYEAFLYAYTGARMVGWYSDFGPDYGADGRPYFFYAYKVASVTYGGRGLYDDDTSEIYDKKVGDPIGVSYLKQKQWMSTIRPVEWNFWFSRLALVVLAVTFILGIWLSISWRPMRESRNQPIIISDG